METLLTTTFLLITMSGEVVPTKLVGKVVTDDEQFFQIQNPRLRVSPLRKYYLDAFTYGVKEQICEQLGFEYRGWRTLSRLNFNKPVVFLNQDKDYQLIKRDADEYGYGIYIENLACEKTKEAS